MPSPLPFDRSATRAFARLTGALLVAALAGLPLAPWAFADPGPSTPNEVARVLAGIAPAEGSPAPSVTRQPAWQRHARAMDRAWSDLERRQLSKVKAWSARELATPRPTLLYTFSGPDFVYAHAFFPQATTYILAGLEPVGQVPTMPAAEGRGNRHARGLESQLGGMRNSIATLVDFGFFKTKRMRTELAERELGGTLPILYVFLARTGHTLGRVERIDLDSDGKLVPVGEGRPKGAAEGVRIGFQGPDGKPRTLYYFRTDLSDRGTAASGFLAFAEALGPRDALLKSASYLLHSASFSRISAHLLARSERIVQDDSGIPLAVLDATIWNRRPFGRYTGPIPLFSSHYQRGLADLHRRAKAPPLDFGIGYRHRRGESSLLVADRLLPVAATPIPPEPKR